MHPSFGKVEYMRRGGGVPATHDALYFCFLCNKRSIIFFLIFRLVSLTPIVMKDFVGNYEILLVLLEYFIFTYFPTFPNRPLPKDGKTERC